MTLYPANRSPRDVVRRISRTSLEFRPRDEEKLETVFARDTHKGILGSAPVKVWLKDGANEIRIGGLDSGVVGSEGKAPDVESLVVYPPEEGEEK